MSHSSSNHPVYIYDLNEQDSVIYKALSTPYITIQTVKLLSASHLILCSLWEF